MLRIELYRRLVFGILLFSLLLGSCLQPVVEISHQLAHQFYTVKTTPHTHAHTHANFADHHHHHHLDALINIVKKEAENNDTPSQLLVADHLLKINYFFESVVLLPSEFRKKEVPTLTFHKYALFKNNIPHPPPELLFNVVFSR